LWSLLFDLLYVSSQFALNMIMASQQAKQRFPNILLTLFSSFKQRCLNAGLESRLNDLRTMFYKRFKIASWKRCLIVL